MTFSEVSRRYFLRTLSGAACLAGCGLAPALLAAGRALEESSLTDRISLITGAGGNIVVYQGASGLTLIDSGAASHTDALLKLLKNQYGGMPVRQLFNTHWHPEHTGGNEALHELGAEIIAHENTRLWLGADFSVEWRQQDFRPRPAAALPQTTFYTSGSRQLDGASVQYHHYPQAHTDGDICLYFADSNVMVAGGLLTSYRYPITDIATGGWLGGLLDANRHMLELADDDTIIVPDQGPALHKRDLQAQVDMLTDLYDQMKALMQQGYSGHDMLQEKITAKYDARWGDPEEFILETYRGMWAHTSDMGGFI